MSNNLKILLEKQILLETKLDFLNYKINNNFEPTQALKDFEMFYKMTFLRSELMTNELLKNDKYVKSDVQLIEEKIKQLFNKYYEPFMNGIYTFLIYHVPKFSLIYTEMLIALSHKLSSRKKALNYLRNNYGAMITKEDLKKIFDEVYETIIEDKLLNSFYMKIRYNLDKKTIDSFLEKMNYSDDFFSLLKKEQLKEMLLFRDSTYIFSLKDYIIKSTSLSYFAEYILKYFKTISKNSQFPIKKSDNVILKDIKDILNVERKDIKDENYYISFFEVVFKEGLSPDIIKTVVKNMNLHHVEKFVDYIFYLFKNSITLKTFDYSEKIIEFMISHNHYFFNDENRKIFFTSLNDLILENILKEDKPDYAEYSEAMELAYKTFETAKNLKNSNDFNKINTIMDSFIHLEHHNGSLYEYVYAIILNNDYKEVDEQLSDISWNYRINNLHAKNFEKEINEIIIFYKRQIGVYNKLMTKENNYE